MEQISNGGTTKRHLPWLDTMRFAAAFLVLLCHSRNDYFVRWNGLMPDEQGIGSLLFYTIGRFGPQAVFAFFVLSGFLVGGPGIERIVNREFRLRSYAIDRFVRIMLPLTAAVVLFVGVALCLGIDFNWWTAVGNLLNLQCILCDSLVTPFWSLSYEVWFYIFLFAVALCVRHRGLGYALFFVCCLVYTRMNSLYLLLWLTGAVAYLVKPIGGGKKWLLWLSGLLVAVTCGLSSAAMESKAIRLGFSIDANVANVLLCASLGLFVQQVVCFPPKRRLAVAIDRLFSKGSRWSYSLYLMHRIFLLIVFPAIFVKEQAHWNLHDVFLFIVMDVAIMLATYAMYLVAESHTAKVKRWMKKRLIP